MMSAICPPTVSVVIPAYRVARYIPDALRSVMEQSYTDYEVIVVDQDMNEAMAKAVESFAGRILHVRKPPTNVAAARNYGIRHARGRYLALLDGDDCWTADFLARLVPMLEAQGGPDVVYPNAVFFGRPQSEGKLFQDSFPSRRPVDFLAILKRESYVFTSVVIRREITERVGGYDEELSSCEDLDLWLRIARAGGRFDFITEPLVRYRLRPDSLTMDRVNTCKTLMQVYSKYLHDSDDAVRELVEARLPVVNAELHLETSKELILEGHYAKARTCLQAANAYYRRPKLAVAGLLLQTFPLLVRWALLRAPLQIQYS